MTDPDITAAAVIHALAEDAKARGDIGKPDGPEAQDWLEHWANSLEGDNAERTWIAVKYLLRIRGAK